MKYRGGREVFRWEGRLKASRIGKEGLSRCVMRVGGEGGLVKFSVDGGRESLSGRFLRVDDKTCRVVY